MKAIENAVQQCESIVQNISNKVGDYLDKHPTLYKVVLVGCHFFRTLAMFGAMVYLPLPMAATAAIMVGGSLVYRASVERFCCFRFTLPSLVGAGAAWAALAGTVNFVSGAAFGSLGMTIASSLAFLPLIGYTGWVIYLSHTDIENKMKTAVSNPSMNEGVSTGACPCAS